MIFFNLKMPICFVIQKIEESAVHVSKNSKYWKKCFKVAVNEYFAFDLLEIEKNLTHIRFFEKRVAPLIFEYGVDICPYNLKLSPDAVLKIYTIMLVIKKEQIEITEFPMFEYFEFQNDKSFSVFATSEEVYQECMINILERNPL